MVEVKNDKMVKWADDVGIEPLESILTLMAGAPTPHANTALDKVVMIRRAEKYLEALRSKLTAEANAAFLKLQVDHSLQNKWAVADGLGFVTRYTPRTEWAYPSEVQQLETELKAKKKACQLDGTAKKLVATADAEKDPNFSVSLTDSW